MKIKQLIYGMTTSIIPSINKYVEKGTGGTDSARYCYSVWLRHLVIANKNGLDPYPKIVAELGPGDSIGIGLAALISGSEKYYGFDVVKHANTKRNIEIFDELLTLFQNRADIPDEDEFPKVKPYLDNYDFPADILDESRLNYALEKSRIDKIKNSIIYPADNSLITYKVPWYEKNIIEKETVDMIYSQAVLEHVDDLKGAYKAMRLWLKPGGYMSHQIDFKCHGTADEWNGHWRYSDFVWKLIRGKRPYLLNREPHSTHLRILKEEGFKLVCDVKIKSETKYTIDELAPRFRFMSEDDLTTSGAFIQAIREN